MAIEQANEKTGGELSDEAIEMQVGVMDFFMKPVVLSGMLINGAAFIGAIVSLISSAFIKTK